MTTQHYCNEPGCLATYPCGVHTKREPINGFKLLIPNRTVSPRQQRFHKIVEINVMPLPCGHSYEVDKEMLPETGRTKKYNIRCPECKNDFYVEITSTVIEFTRLN